MVEISHQQWLAEAERRYGKSGRKVRFCCPSCGHTQSGEDFLALGLTPEEAASRCGFSCIGRWKTIGPIQDAFTGGPGPCNYAGGGLIRISPIAVIIEARDEPCYAFDFADDPLVTAKEPATV